jgi:hypothetical protein
MSHSLAIALFSMTMGALGMLVVWEHRRGKRGPIINAEKFQEQLGGPKIAYEPPPERRRRSMDRKR